jgi:hypothetical protein
MEYIKGQTLSAHIPSDGMDQAISGQRPFKGENTEAIIGRILTEEPKAVTELKPVTPYTLWVLIRQGLKKDSTQRMQTARRLHTAHVDVQRGVQAGTVPVDAKALPPPPEPNAAFRRSHSILLLAIGLLIGLPAAWLLKPVPQLPLRALFNGDSIGFTLSGNRKYDVAEEGQRFLMVRTLKGHGSLKATIVENWVREFEDWP